MAVKLVKACRELNIGMSTLTDWCERNGYFVESEPKYLLSDELYEKLKQHFAHKPDAYWNIN
jgi:translation initiation factor IF-2